MSGRRILAIVAFGLLLASGLRGGGVMPTPFGGKVELKDAWFVIVEESENRPQFVSLLKTDAELWAEVATIGSRHSFIDIDAKQADTYRGKANDIGIPAAFLVNGDATVVWSGPLPETREGVIKAVKQEAK
jgi:hypothetical protein